MNPRTEEADSMWLLGRRRGRQALAQLPPARRLWPTTAEAQQMRQGFLLTHEGGELELVLTFDDGGPAYAAQLDGEFAQQLRAELERCMTAIEPLLHADIQPTKEKS